MPFYYPLHLRERFERMHRQRIADVDRVKAFAARHLAELFAPPLIPILVPAAGYPYPRRRGSKPE